MKITPLFLSLASLAFSGPLSSLPAQEEKADKPAQKSQAEKPAPKKKTKPVSPAEKASEAKARVEIKVRSKEATKDQDKDAKPAGAKKQPSIVIRRNSDRDHGRTPERSEHGVKPRTWLGIAMREVPPALREYLELPEGFGVQVDHVAEDSPAAEAGLKVHDILLELDDQKIISPEHVAILVRAKRQGEKVELSFVRKGKEEKVQVTLGQRSLPPFSDFPTPKAFGFHYGEPGENHHFEFQLPHDLSDPDAWQKHVKKYQDDLQQWMAKNPEAFRWRQMEPARPQGRPMPPKTRPAPKRDQPAASNVKPIPPLPGKGGDRPPSIMVKPGFPLQVFGGAGLVKIDNEKGAITITNKDGKHTIAIENEDGETVYEGPYDAKKGTKGLPEEARKQLEKMKMTDLKLLMRPNSKPDAPAVKKPSRDKGDKVL